MYCIDMFVFSRVMNGRFILHRKGKCCVVGTVCI